MGHVINPVSFRLSKNKFWENNLVNYKFTNNQRLNLLRVNISKFIERFFNLKIFLGKGLLYSHNQLFFRDNSYVVNIYLYKTIKNKFDDKKTYFINYNFKLLRDKILLKYNKKINKIILLYFNKMYKIFSKNSKKKTDTSFFLIYQLKKLRFLLIKKYFGSNLTANRKLQYLTIQLFYKLIRKRFWGFILKFLNFYLKPYLQGPVKVNIYILPKVTIDIIKKYIIVRLQQRFTVSQLISPVLKDLRFTDDVLGFKFSFSGRFSRREMATYEWFSEGAVPSNTVNAFIEYRQFKVLLKDGLCGIKVWINRDVTLKKKRNLLYLLTKN